MENNKKANVIVFPVSYEDLERMYLLPYLREKFAQAGFYNENITQLNIEISHEGENWFFTVLVSGAEVGLGVEEWMRSTYTDLRERTGNLFPPMGGIPITRHWEGNTFYLNLHTPESDQCFLKAIKSLDPSFDKGNNLRLSRSVACRSEVLFLFEERTPASADTTLIENIEKLTQLRTVAKNRCGKAETTDRYHEGYCDAMDIVFQTLSATPTVNIPEDAFEYNGYHFVGDGKFPSAEEFNPINAISTGGSFRFIKNDGMWDYDDFYRKSGEYRKDDIFRCVETNELYVPGTNELFLYITKNN